MASILVVYASKHGATEGIAQRIAQTLIASGHFANVHRAKDVQDLAGYGAFVIGSATYMGSWIAEAAEFVRHNEAALAVRPVWLFSSGPLGAATTDARGRDVMHGSEPKEFAEFAQSLKPRDERVFFGALNARGLGVPGRVLRTLPAGRRLLPLGDFRNWTEIESWARSIARELAPAPREAPDDSVPAVVTAST
jgi:menaquinone-dependent protoporphyrinogen oxidase